MQLNHYNTKFKPQTFPIVLVSDNVINAPNIGSLFRMADAFGIEKLIICGEHIPLGRKMAKTSRSTEKWVNYEVNNSALRTIKTLKSEGFLILALEITNTSRSIHNLKFSNKKPIAVVIGDENFGVSEDILNLADDTVHIDMFGKNSSMNVVQATNVALYEITKQLRLF